ncbi:hypothetical protein [Plantactinospora sp. GCM10030261]|uniref:hypothetical protein n=1 Tax=Plantactinospora sp. GCM10030261 TaxID=3273420 RepID=UPI0036198713
MAPRLARTNVEAHLYMDLTPCDACGETTFRPASSFVDIDGELIGRYTAACPRCGSPREFVFRMPDEIIRPDEDEPTFGDDRPSELIDAGEWLWVADLLGDNAPAEPTAGMTAAQRRQAFLDLRMAAAAVGEAAKFLPAGADTVPQDALWSRRGRSVYAAQPGRFHRARLEAVQRVYRELADRFADRAS